jgi:hypothetical protein
MARAARAAIIRQILLLLVRQRLLRLAVWILQRRLKRRVERLNLVRLFGKIYLLGLARFAFGNLKFVGFPNIRARRREFVIAAVLMLLRHKLRPAKTAEITRLIINLSAILAM